MHDGRPGTIGTDVVDVERLRRIRGRNPGRFDALAFTEPEIAYCRSKQHPEIHFAGHLAAKEATFKALRMRWEGPFSWRFLEVGHRTDGSPTVTLSSDGARALGKLPLQGLSVSIAHTDDVAIAVAWAPGESTTNHAD